MTTDNYQTTNPSDQFKQRLTDVLQDIQQVGQKDGETMALIGSVALVVADRFQQPDWSGAKQAMSANHYTDLLKSFDKEGQSLLQSGQKKRAYAIQALATSLVARSRRSDPQIAQGETLLDALIDHTVKIHRQQIAKRN